MAYTQVIDHVCLDPKGSVNMNAAQRLSTADKRDRRKARTRSHIATSRLKRSLQRHQIVQGDDSSWRVMRGGEVIGVFPTVSEAVSFIS